MEQVEKPSLATFQVLRLGSDSHSYFQAVFVPRVGWVSFFLFLPCGPYRMHGYWVSGENSVS